MEEEWEKLSLYCPNCGKQEVWHDTGPGDYYTGERYMCKSCAAVFFLPLGVKTDPLTDLDLERIKAIRSNT